MTSRLFYYSSLLMQIHLYMQFSGIQPNSNAPLSASHKQAKPTTLSPTCSSSATTAPKMSKCMESALPRH